MVLPHDSSGKNGYGPYLSLGAEITSAMLVPLVGGYLVDYYFGTEPWGFLGGMVVGFLGVFNVIYRIALRANKKNKENRHEE